MTSRVAWLLITAFWVTMNVLLWRAEYGPRGGGTPVPLELVCRKILTAPDPSTMSVYQHGQKMGFCSFSTGIEQEMAQLNDNAPPPEGLVARAGYQIRLNGNVAFGSFTNRLRFDTHVKFSPNFDWRELDLKMTTPSATVVIHSLATNQTVFVQITNTDGLFFKRDFTFGELQNPGTLLRALDQGLGGGGPLSGFNLPFAMPGGRPGAESLPWRASRVRMMVDREPVFAYRLETRVLGQPMVIHVSTIGEILRADLPDGITATLDQWSQ